MKKTSMVISLGCVAYLSACGGGGSNTPQMNDSQGRNSTLPSSVPAENRGYEFDVYPNGRAPSALREVEITVPAANGLDASADQEVKK